MPYCPAASASDLPIAEMPAEDDRLPAGGEDGVEVFRSGGFDRPVRREHPDMPQMRVFRRDPAEIVPHAADHALDLRRRKLRQCGTQIAAGAAGDRQTRADPPRRRTAERGGQSQRHRPHHGT